MLCSIGNGKLWVSAHSKMFHGVGSPTERRTRWYQGNVFVKAHRHRNLTRPIIASPEEDAKLLLDKFFMERYGKF